jgi:hypothetical protein
MSAIHRPLPRPAIVGHYSCRGEMEFLPLSDAELWRAQLAMGRMLDSYGIVHGRCALLISLLSEVAQILPLELALVERHVTYLPADASRYEFTRIEALLRRFDVALVARVTLPVLEGLEAAGMDPARLFRNRVVYAEGPAYDRLADIEGIELRRWLQLGPALALECRHGGGAHVDGYEWNVAEEDGEIVIGSRLDRCEEHAHFRTGIAGRVSRELCACGDSGPRILLGP